MSAVGICRCEKIHDRSGLRARAAHNSRSKLVRNADQKFVARNRNLRPDISTDILDAFDKRHAAIGSPRLRKNGVLGLEYVLTFSPQAVSDVDPDAWAVECLKFIEARHGRDNILSAYLHRDERTPHVHIVAVPEFAGAIVVGPFMGNRGALIRLQDEFHQEVSRKFGLARTSESPTGRKHLSPAQMRAASGPTNNALQAALAAIDAAAVTPRIEPLYASISAPNLLTAKGREAFVNAVRADAEVKANGAVVAVRNEAKRIVTNWHEIARESLLLRQENQVLKHSQSSVLRDLDLREVAEHVLGFAGLREGSSAVWENESHKLVISGAKFKDFKAPQHGLGGGAIDLVMHLLQCPYAQAISVLAGMSPDRVAGAIASYHRRRAHLDTVQARATAKPFGFQEQLQRYAQRDDGKLAQAREYLIRSRKIDASVVDRVIETGDLWANKWGSAVFAHRNRNGELTGCSIRATQGDFKQSLGDKTNAWFSVGSPIDSASTFALVESAIDALSLAELDELSPGTAYVSTSGQCRPDPLLSFGRKLKLAQDSDAAGDAMAAEFAACGARIGIAATRRRPAAKDWNEFLAQTKNEHRRIAAEIEDRERAAREREHETLERERRLHTSAPDQGGFLAVPARVRNPSIRHHMG